MSSQKDSRSRNPDRDGTEHIEQLLQHVEPRPLPGDRKERVRGVVRAEWEGSVRHRRRRRYWLGASLAAVLVLAVLPVSRFWMQERALGSEGEPIGQVALIRGLVWLATPDTPEAFPGRRLQSDDLLQVGTRIETTEDSRVALRIGGGPSLRLSRGTRIRFVAPRVVEMERGALYVDSGASSEEEDRLEIRTDLGSVQEIGTQFEVRLLKESLRVRVREGAVYVENDREPHEAVAGTELSVDALGRVSKRQVPTVGPIWNWVLEIAPPFDLEGSSLADFLGWVSRETGMAMRFPDDSTRQASSDVILSGSVEGLRPSQALEAVLPTCGLIARSEGTSLILTSAPQ